MKVCVSLSASIDSSFSECEKTITFVDLPLISGPNPYPFHTYSTDVNDSVVSWLEIGLFEHPNEALPILYQLKGSGALTNAISQADFRIRSDASYKDLSEHVYAERMLWEMLGEMSPVVRQRMCISRDRIQPFHGVSEQGWELANRFDLRYVPDGREYPQYFVQNFHAPHSLRVPVRGLTKAEPMVSWYLTLTLEVAPEFSSNSESTHRFDVMFYYYTGEYGLRELVQYRFVAFLTASQTVPAETGVDEEGALQCSRGHLCERTATHCRCHFVFVFETTWMLADHIVHVEMLPSTHPISVANLAVISIEMNSTVYDRAHVMRTLQKYVHPYQGSGDASRPFLRNIASRAALLLPVPPSSLLPSISRNIMKYGTERSFAAEFLALLDASRESCHRIVQHHGHSLEVFPKDSAADVVQTFSNFLTLHLQAVASTQLQLRANLDALRIETDKQMFLKDISSHKLYTSESQSSTQHQCTNIAESTQQFKSFRESASVRLSESYPKITQLESHFSSLRTLIDSVQNVQDYVTSGPFSSMLQSQP